MEQIQNTPKVHTAFNPCIISGSPSGGELIASIDIHTDGGVIIKTHEFFNGVAQFDISKTLQKLFINQVAELDATINLGANKVYEDYGLFLKYHTESSNVNGWDESEKTAINAVVQIGESSDLTPFRNKFLTEFDRIKFYKNFPQNAYFLSGNAGNTSILFATVEDDAFATTTANDTVISSPMIFIDGYYQPAIIRLYSDDWSICDERMIDNMTTPENPLYVRWINRMGGRDYWMFGYRQSIGRSVTAIQTYKPAISNQQTAKATHQTINLEGFEKVRCGAGQLTENEYEVVSKLIYSPNIEYYNQTSQTWLSMTIDKGENENDTHDKLKELEFTFNLPEPQLQF